MSCCVCEIILDSVPNLQNSFSAYNHFTCNLELPGLPGRSCENDKLQVGGIGKEKRGLCPTESGMKMVRVCVLLWKMVLFWITGRETWIGGGSLEGQCVPNGLNKWDSPVGIVWTTLWALKGPSREERHCAAEWPLATRGRQVAASLLYSLTLLLNYPCTFKFPS